MKFDKNFVKHFGILKLFADGKVTTAVSTTGNSVLLSDATRIVYSREIEFKAQPLMRFRQFATIKTELGVEPGLTINMFTYDNLVVGGELEENVDLQTQALSGSSKQITVVEYGNAVSVTNLLTRSSYLDILRDTTTALGRDYAIVMDSLLRDAALSGTNRVYADKSDGTEVTSRTDLDSTCILQVKTIKDAIEILATNNAPKWNGDYWVCFVHPHQSRDLRDDPDWINTSNYSNPDMKLIGEIGRIDDTRFIETTIMRNGAAPQGDPAYTPYLISGFAGDADNPAVNTNVFQAVIFGEDYYGLAISQPMEFRTNGVEDFRRKVSLAWYGIWGAGRLHNDHGVVVETA